MTGRIIMNIKEMATKNTMALPILRAFASRGTKVIIPLTTKFISALMVAGASARGSMSPPAIRAMILDRVPGSRWGSANATNLVLYDLGHARGPLVLGFIAERSNLPMTFGFSALAPLIAILLIVMTGLHLEEPPRRDGE